MRSSLKRLLPYMVPYWHWLSVSILCMAAVASLTAGAMWLIKIVIDMVLTEKDVQALLNAVLLVIILFGVKGILAYIHDYLTAYAGYMASMNLRNNLYAKIHSLSLDYFNREASARLISILTNDITIIQETISRVPVTVIKDGLSMIFLVGLLLHLNWKLSLLSFAIFPFCGFLIMIFGRKIKKAGKQSQAKMADIYQNMQEALTAIPVVKAYMGEAYELKRFKTQNRSFFDIKMRVQRAEALSHPVMEFIGALGIAALLWIGGHDVIKGVWTPGAFFAFLGSVLSLYQPIKNFARSNVSIQQANAAGERVFEIFDIMPSVADKPLAQSLAAFGDRINYDHVSFAYRAGRNVVDKVSLEIKKGEVVAIVGPSGSGKTTMAYLLLRFYDSISGRITIDGKDIKEITLMSLRKNIGVVSQDVILFNATVKENIAYGLLPDDGSINNFDIIKSAAEVANAHEFIMNLPHGYDTMVGEKGVLLSGGQKQRIAIARALVKDPPILILDEATSALDSESEKAVHKAIEQLMTGRTVIIIAHRLSTAKSADKIIVMENGRIVESGNHDELTKGGGLYNRLYELQLL